MHRCLQLARLGEGNVAPNPMVGSVLVHKGVIIGEGYHQKYGEAHAEVNCINSVKPEHRHLIEHATIYVSLEPCAHFGKTPPCADLIIKHKIPKVVIGCRDPFEQVAGKGIDKMIAGGIEVIVGVLEEECKDLNKRFFLFHSQHRPYIVLKWAETGDRKIAGQGGLPPELRSQPLVASGGGGGGVHPEMNRTDNRVGEQRDKDDSTGKDHSNSGGVFPVTSPTEGGREGAVGRLLISNEYTNRIVHQWRSEEVSILVGTNTALLDDPRLDTRLWPGNNPIRLVVDMDLRLPLSLKVFSGTIPTIVFNTQKHTLPENSSLFPFPPEQGDAPLLYYYQVSEGDSLIHQIVNALYQMKIQSVLVEGGARLLQSFIDEDLWDEARVITNGQLIIGNGLPAPELQNHKWLSTEQLSTDTIHTYLHLSSL